MYARQANNAMTHDRVCYIDPNYIYEYSLYFDYYAYLMFYFYFAIPYDHDFIVAMNEHNKLMQRFHWKSH